DNAWDAAQNAIWWTSGASREGVTLRQVDAAASERSNLIRELFNPFAPATPHLLRSPTVVAIAESIYQEQQFSDLPCVADALEEAECKQEDVLRHCRAAGHHVRGCWALDLILGKS